jgi:hypothetical protein
VNRENAIAILERHEGVDRCAAEELAPNRGASMINCEPGGNDESQSPLRLQKRQRTFDE